MAKVHSIDNLALQLPEEEADKPRIEHNKTEAVQAAAPSKTSIVAWSLLMIVALALLASLIFGKVEISRLYNTRAELESELIQMRNENVSLQSELAERMNMIKVEEYAKNSLGLQKLDKSQIEYVEVETPSAAEVKLEDNEDIFAKIKHWFKSAKEYIGL